MSRARRPAGPSRRTCPPWLLLVLMCSAQFLNVANISSVNIALPDLAADLGVEEATLPWVVSAYLVTFAGFLLVSGRVADLVGRKVVLVSGFAIFAGCAVVNTWAVNVEMLIAGRVVQGVGAAATIPAALGILTVTFTERAERSRAVAAFGAAGAVGFASGLVLGGLVTGPLGWRWVFGLTVPLAAVLLVLTALRVPEDRPDQRATGRVDILGALTATGGLLGLVFAFTNASRSGWSSAVTVVTATGGVALLGVFVLVQAQTRDPLMPLGLWLRPNLPAAVVLGFCNFGAWVGANFFLSLTLQRVLGYGAGEAALALLPLAIGGLVFATLAGRLLPRLGGKPLLVVGLGGFAAGLALLATLQADTGYFPHLFAAVVLAVAGNAWTFVGSNVLAMAQAGPDEQSLVGGLFNTGMQVGGSLGLAVMGLVASTWLTTDTEGTALLPGYRAAFWTAAGFAAAGLVVAMFLASGTRVGGSDALRRPRRPRM